MTDRLAPTTPTIDQSLYQLSLNLRGKNRDGTIAMLAAQKYLSQRITGRTYKAINSLPDASDYLTQLKADAYGLSPENRGNLAAQLNLVLKEIGKKNHIDTAGKVPDSLQKLPAKTLKFIDPMFRNGPMEIIDYYEIKRESGGKYASYVPPINGRLPESTELLKPGEQKKPPQ